MGLKSVWSSKRSGLLVEGNTSLGEGRNRDKERHVKMEKIKCVWGNWKGKLVPKGVKDNSGGEGGAGS